MKRIWQVSTSLMLAALLAHSASAQGFNPRSWKANLPGSYRPTIVSDEQSPAPAVDPADVKPAAAVEESEPAAEQQSSRKTAQGKTATPVSIVAKTGEAPKDSSKSEKFASYYSQNETPPPAPGLLQNGQGSPSDQASPFRDEGAIQPIASNSAVGCSNDASCGCNSCAPGNNSCDPMTSGCDDVCNQCMPTRNFAKIEYLMWWGKGRSTPPLVTSSFAGTPAADAGELGLPTTTILYGGNDIGTDWRSGLRLQVGRVLDAEGNWMAVGRFYGLNDSEDSFHAESALGDPILARPFFNVVLAQQDALLVAYPGVSQNGVIDIESRSDMLGAEALVRHMMLGEEDLTVDFVAGYQFNRLDDSLNISNSELILVDPQGIFAPGTTIAMRDTFRTRNEFHGGVVGLAADVFRGPFRIEMLGKVGFGNQRQTVTIDGNTQITPAVGPVANDPQGLLARATNSGTFNRDVFTIIPEANFTLGYQVNNWTFSIGYSFMYWKDVAWAGDQIDLRSNLSNPLVGAPLPEFQFQNTDHWLQGLSFGAELAF